MVLDFVNQFAFYLLHRPCRNCPNNNNFFLSPTYVFNCLFSISVSKCLKHKLLTFLLESWDKHISQFNSLLIPFPSSFPDPSVSGTPSHVVHRSLYYNLVSSSGMIPRMRIVRLDRICSRFLRKLHTDFPNTHGSYTHTQHCRKLFPQPRQHL